MSMAIRTTTQPDRARATAELQRAPPITLSVRVQGAMMPTARAKKDDDQGALVGNRGGGGGRSAAGLKQDASWADLENVVQGPSLLAM
jgi:hypothetical protein